MIVPEELFLIIRVNREFERVFGYSQASMRDLFRSEGSKVLYRLLAPPSLPLLTQWLTEAMLGGRTEYRQLVTIINKYKGQTECILNCRWTFDNSGIFRQMTHVYTPMPEKPK